MKYKKLTRDQLIISFDRLTRFKFTKDKYFRVFSEIVLSNLSEPVFKKTELAEMPVKDLTSLAVIIINDSLNDLFPKSGTQKDKNINNVIKEYENSLFVNDTETQDYLNNSINYNLAVNLIDESSPINLRWLKTISKGGDLKILRERNGLKFPIEKVLLVEWITEEILLPAFSKYLGYDFYRKGVQIIPAGGKNQVVKLYYKLSAELKIPIFVLLDKDAFENISQIQPRLRPVDKIHLVSCGEFEDLLPRELILKTVNNELNNFTSVSNIDFDNSLSNAKNLENIFKTKGLHEFKQADFAKLVKDNISKDSDISEEIKLIIKELKM